jgi:CRP/FNR family cyclic AMP-dependent transcriptional regulator
MDRITAARDVVSNFGWLSRTPPHFRKAVLDMSQRRTFAADETIHAAGDPAGGIYGLVSGGLRVVFAPSERIPFFAHFFVPGSWTGEAAAITGEPRLVSLVTTRETCAFYLPLPAVNEILRKDPDAFRSFAKLMQWHLATAIAATGDLMIRDPAQRLIAVLLRLCGCRLATPEGLGPLDVDLSQDELAFMANVGRTTASAVLGRLQSAGQVELTYRRIQINAPETLRAMLTEQRRVIAIELLRWVRFRSLTHARNAPRNGSQDSCTRILVPISADCRCRIYGKFLTELRGTPTANGREPRYRHLCTSRRTRTVPVSARAFPSCVQNTRINTLASIHRQRPLSPLQRRSRQSTTGDPRPAGIDPSETFAATQAGCSATGRSRPIAAGRCGAKICSLFGAQQPAPASRKGARLGTMRCTVIETLGVQL